MKELEPLEPHEKALLVCGILQGKKFSVGYLLARLCDMTREEADNAIKKAEALGMITRQSDFGGN